MTQSPHVALLYNAPVLPPDHPDYASEVGVLESVAAFHAELRGLGHRVDEIPAGNSVAFLTRQLEQLRPEIVVNLCESFAGCSAGEPYIAALLELLNLPYTGSAPECLALTHDKPETKRVLIGGGVTTPEFVEILLNQTLPESKLRQWLSEGPVIVKPACEDASLGIGPESVAQNWESLSRQVTLIHQRFGAALIERYIAGREFNVGIIELPHLQILPIAEVQLFATPKLAWPIVTYASKWAPGSSDDLATPVRCPAIIDVPLQRRLQAAAAAAYQLVRCRDYARIDLRVDNQGNVFVLEANANPDIGPTAGFARMLRTAGIDYADFCRRLLKTVRDRKKPGIERQSTAKTVSKNGIFDNPSNGRKCHQVKIRKLRPEDRKTLVEITRSCGVFRPDEIKIADEVLESALRNGTSNDYQVLVAESMDHGVGWSCHGPVPLTDATFDLYWIVVAADAQGQGIGKKLIGEVEHAVRAANGRWLLAQTSSTNVYNRTRSFYLSCSFKPVSQIEDFYRPGDGKITFGKRLDES